MGLLQSRGLDLYAAYGNTPTDIRAYVAHGIAKVRVLGAVRAASCKAGPLQVAMC